MEALVADHPEYALAHAALSVFYQQLERNDEAVEHAGKVCELEPEDPFSFVAMSNNLPESGTNRRGGASSSPRLTKLRWRLIARTADQRVDRVSVHRSKASAVNIREVSF